MQIEIIPVEKSCQQGCAVCPLSSRGGQNTKNKTIDSNVQKTFSLVEKILAEINWKYDLHYASDFNLMPTFKYPELVSYARFETSKEIRLEGNSLKFSQDIHKAVKHNNLNPFTVGFSLVPHFPLVSQVDIDLGESIINEIKSWHFNKRNRHIYLTLRSNMIKSKTFLDISKNLISHDNQLVLPLLTKHGKTIKEESEISNINIGDMKTADLFYSEYVSVKNQNKVIVSNRIIAPTVLNNNHIELSLRACRSLGLNPRDKDIMIAPQGVMLNHSSIEINNPILWIGHDDFRKSLISMYKKYKKRDIFNKFIFKIMSQNSIMYLLSENNTPVLDRKKMTPETMMLFYSRHRTEVSKYLPKKIVF